jgi:asparagine synthase (glutamine-hydrolysing)
VKQFPPGQFWTHDYSVSNHKISRIDRWFSRQWSSIHSNEHEIIITLQKLLLKAVTKRLMSDRPIGCLLSGGLDSSIIAAIVNRYMRKQGKTLCTFSIGLKDSPDLIAARKVANYLETEHYEFVVTEKDLINAIPQVIYNIESYDTTTVRASVPNYLISWYIAKYTDIKVIFNGDGADELFGGYYYHWKLCPDAIHFFKENGNLIRNIHFFDVLRSDRCISTNGLEPRTPFLDRKLVDYIMCVAPYIKHNPQIEKWLLRTAFDSTELLPDSILWRSKEAFSDAISKKSRSWYQIIQDYVGTFITDEQLQKAQQTMAHCTPKLKESLYYRQLFNIWYPNHDQLIPRFWMPKWTDAVDPSARVLN